jgi:predicted permease
MLMPALLVHTVRGLVRTPFFTITAVLSLAIGIGANTTIFTAANALLFAPTPGVTAPDRLVDIGRTERGSGFDTVSYLTYRDVAALDSVFAGVQATRLEPEAMSLGGANGADRVYAQVVSASFFDVLGVRPAAGSFFRTGEEAVGTPLRKAVLTHALWTRRFNADPSIVGAEILLNGESFVVAGVTAEGFRGTTVIWPDLWIPLTAHARGTPAAESLQGREYSSLMMVARLAPGVSIDQARQAVDALAARLQRDFPEIYEDRGLVVAPASRVPGEIGTMARGFLALLMGLVGLVQLVACTNLAALILARTTTRTKEIALRLALGASRWSIVGLLLTETLVLFAAGGALALLIARWSASVLASLLAEMPFPVAADLSLDGRVLAFVALITIGTGALTGLVPALQSTTAVAADLKADAMAPRRRRLRHAFVTAQIAASFVLVVLAGLLFTAIGQAARLDSGMTIDGVDVASVSLNLSGAPRERWSAVAEDIAGRLRTLPGVTSVGAARMVPLQGGGMGLGDLRKPGTTGDDASIDADWNAITPGFFPTVGIPIVAGRDFAPADRDGSQQVTIVNQRFAALVWPGQNPIGQVLERGDFRPGREASIQRMTVVGVVRDARYRTIGESPRSAIYAPLAQLPMAETHFFIRRAGDDGAFHRTVRATLRDYDRNLPLVSIASFRDLADIGLLPQRIAGVMAGVLGAVALLLGGIGIYGVTAFAVATRTREIGLRVALGADPSRIRRLIVGQGLRLTAIGGGLGLLVSLGAAQLIRSLLFGVSPADPVSFGLTGVGLGAVALAASVVPAMRAARLEPVRALRAD